jgi:hypothetical protein
VNSIAIQYPACRGEALKERRLVTRIQYQSILATVSIEAAKIGFINVCNQRVNSGIKPPLPVVDAKRFYRSGESQKTL